MCMCCTSQFSLSMLFSETPMLTTCGHGQPKFPFFEIGAPEIKPGKERILGLQSARLCLSTNTSAIPGNVPNPPNFDLYEDDHQKMALAVDLAESYAINVAPATVPEAAGRAMQSEVQADISACQIAFLSASCAVVALSTGTLLHLSLKVSALCCPHIVSSQRALLKTAQRKFMLSVCCVARRGKPSRAQHCCYITFPHVERINPLDQQHKAPYQLRTSKRCGQAYLIAWHGLALPMFRGCPTLKVLSMAPSLQ